MRMALKNKNATPAWLMGFLFVVASTVAFIGAPGDDLSSSYMACRLLAQGETEAIYAHDEQLFHVVENPAWNAAASEANFQGFLHPYVQTPLWAFLLRPLCTNMEFPLFQGIFLFLAAFALALTVFVVTSALSFKYPNTLFATALLWLWLSLPFEYGMLLTQTHAIFVAASVSAMLLAERRYEVPAGLLLSAAAAVKITPLLLGVYWLATGRWRALVSLMVGSLLLFFLGWLVTGTEVMTAYIDTLRRISNTLLVSYNNHSIPALIMAPHYVEEITNWRILPLPSALSIAATIAGTLLILTSGLARRHGAPEGATLSLSLLGMTAFPPIAWSHYYIILVVPIMWMGTQPKLRIPALVVAAIACIPHTEYRTLVYAALASILICLVELLSSKRSEARHDRCT